MPSGDTFGFIYNGEEYYYIKNVQNDIVAIADKNGDIVANYYYDAWGNVTQITGNTALAQTNPLRYRSYYYDSETGLYYVSSRYYDPEIGRWINADNVIAGVGGDVMFMPDPALNTGYFGLTGNVGFGTPGKEFHVEWGTTRLRYRTPNLMFMRLRDLCTLKLWSGRYEIKTNLSASIICIIDCYFYKCNKGKCNEYRIFYRRSF